MALETERQANIGARIRQRKEELHITEQDIADACAVDKRTVQNWIAGKGIGNKNWGKLSTALETTEDWLLNGDEIEPSQLDVLEEILRENHAMLRQVLQLLGEDPGARIEAELEDAVAESSRRRTHGSAEDGRAPHRANRRPPARP